VSLLPPWPVALPLLMAALLVGAGPFVRRRIADAAAIATAAATTVLTALLFARASPGPLVYWFGGWLPRNGLVVGIDFAVDAAGAALATLAGVLMTSALVFTWRYFEAVGTLFHALMLVFLAAVLGFCLTGDLFNLFVFFELLSVAAYALAGYRTEDPGSIQGALNFAVTNSVGGFMVLSGIALLYGRSGSLNLAEIGRVLERGPSDGLVVVAFALLLAGFFVKAAVVPFHFWLADAYAVAPTPVCILLAGVVSELGLYAAARVYWTVFAGVLAPHAAALRGVLLGAATLTALLGALMCYLQQHLARLLAFATVSHVGLTLTGIALLQPDGLAGALVYMVADGLVKAALFVCVGVLQYRLDTVEERALHGRGRGLTITFGLLLVGGLALAGLPPFGTFLGKALMEEAASRAGHGWVSWLFVVASAVSAAAVLRAGLHVFTGWSAPPGGPGPAAAQAPGRTGASGPPEPAHDRGGFEPAGSRTHPTMLAPAALLLLAALALGLLPGLSGRAQAAAERFSDQRAYAAAVLDGVAAQPAAGAAAAVDLAQALPLAALTVVLAGVLAATVPARRPRTRGPRRQAAWRGVARATLTLRRLHSGQVGDSIAWLVVGTAGLGALLTAALR
jgi:multicomponent Na+:H+ antiporter subunit D